MPTMRGVFQIHRVLGIHTLKSAICASTVAGIAIVKARANRPASDARHATTSSATEPSEAPSARMKTGDAESSSGGHDGIEGAVLPSAR